MDQSQPIRATDRRAPPAGGPLSIDVSVLVPVLDEAAHIRNTVEAMRAQRGAGRIELLFADGGSRDSTRRILEELASEDPRVRVFDNPLRSTPSGLNVCLRHARGEYVARMDAHSFYPDNYLASGVERLRRGGTSWVSGPAIPTPTGPVGRAVALALATPLGQGGSRKWSLNSAEHELDSGVFAGVWRRETLLSYGGWDERWPANQDSEMAGRFLRRGERLLCLPEMAACYLPRESLRSLARQYRRYGYYRARTARRHPDSLRRSALLAPAAAGAWLLALAGTRSVRTMARLGVAAHVTAVMVASVPAAREAPRDAVFLPAVLLTMHVANGAGYLQGFMRFGPPWSALARMIWPRRLREDHLAARETPVYAPSLHGDG